MSISAQKAKAPISSVVIAPINESVKYEPNNTIVFRIGPADILYWLIQDSYFVFDVEWTRTTSDSTIMPKHNLVVRGSGMFFDNVTINHAGVQVYYSQYNIAQQFLDYVKSGDDYLNANYNEWTTHKTYAEAVSDNTINTPLIIKQSDWKSDGTNYATTVTKKGVVVRVGQILKCLSRCEMFPLKYLSQQMEIRFQLADPEKFLLSAAYVTGTSPSYAYLKDANFADCRGNDNTACGITSGGTETNEVSTFPGTTVFSTMTYQIKNCRLYMFGEDVDPSYDAVMKADNEGGVGKVWRYNMPQIALRNVPQTKPGYIISNFQAITENTDKIFIWACRNNNYNTTIRPHLTQLQLKFGPYNMPKSPTEDPNWERPIVYKALVDDTLEYSTAYYTSCNRDLYNCYYPIPEASTDNTGFRHDTYIMLASSFTTDDGKLGSNSKMWNSQYNLHYNLLSEEPAWTWVLAVDYEAVLMLRDGRLSRTEL